MTQAPEQNQVVVPPGVVAITTYGQIQPETTQSLVEMVRHCERNGLKDVRYDFILGNLVDKTRNEAARRFLETKGAEWLWFLDADMQFAPNLPDIMLETAYNSCKWADIVGGWCPLKGGMFTPTIDRGSGLWEPHDAQQGPIEVIRTGGACLLIKRHVLERMGAPWFGVRQTPRAIDALAEVDGYARQRFDGRNPLEHSVAWQKLLACAREDARGKPAEAGSVGEDSSFCDRAKALGFRIVVQTNAELGHLARQLITSKDHIEKLTEARENDLACVGVTG